MFDFKCEDNIRAQEVALFGGCVEDPKNSYGDSGVGFSPTRKARKSTAKATAERIDEEILFEIRVNFDTGDFEQVLKF